MHSASTTTPCNKPKPKSSTKASTTGKAQEARCVQNTRGTDSVGSEGPLISKALSRLSLSPGWPCNRLLVKIGDVGPAADDDGAVQRENGADGGAVKLGDGADGGAVELVDGSDDGAVDDSADSGVVDDGIDRGAAELGCVLGATPSRP